jgi:spore germination protein YaaH
MQQAAASEATATPGPLQPNTTTGANGQVAVGGAGGLQREVFGFGLLSSIADPTVGYPSWDFSLLSTVAVFGLHVQTDGNFAADSSWNQWNSTQLSAMVSRAHSYATKVVLTIILQDFSAGTPNMCAGLKNRATTVQRTVAEVVAKGVDGVNIDYEGLGGSCANGENPQADMTDLAKQLRSALPQASPYLSVDTYASSAGDPSGFFNVPGLNAYVDSFFVMAYDSDWSNYTHPPLSCSRYCLNPVSPLTGYYYNDTRAATEYASAVPATKVILGLPYYGRYSCVNAWAPNQYPAPGWTTFAMTYRSSVAMPGDATNSNYALHRDGNDAAGMTPWSSWTSASGPACPYVESYWDDTTSLGQKYDLVNRAGLRGVGIWNLNQGGGSPELWSLLSTYFSCPVTVTSPPPPTTTQFSVSMTAGSCSVASFEVQQYDSTLSQGWYGLTPAVASAGSGTEVVDGNPGYTYQFRARANTAAGVIGSWSTAVTVTVDPSATYSHPFKGLHTLDGFGGIQSDDSAPLGGGPYWAGWRIARAAHAQPGPNVVITGFVLDGWGGLQPYGSQRLTAAGGPYWPNWDIARDFAWLPDGSGGYVLDGWGGLHPFAVGANPVPPTINGNAYWPNWDIARKVVIFADGKGGYVLDGWGGIHGFGIGGPAPVGNGAVQNAYWPNWNIARDIVLLPNSHSGYTLDGFGGIQPFAPVGQPLPPKIAGAYWPNWDIARGIWLLPGSSTQGYTLDGWGGLHAFGGLPPIARNPYWPGWDIAIGLLGA